MKQRGRGWLHKGYRWISTPDRGKIKEHRYVMEKRLGRRLQRREYVHHKNGVKTDNRFGNLEVVTPAQHNTMHKKLYEGTCVKCHNKKGDEARRLCKRCYEVERYNGSLHNWPLVRLVAA